MKSLHGTVELTDATITSFIQQSPIAFIDFWNERCIPCKQIAPILEELAITYSGRIWIGKVDIDYNVNAASTYGIYQLPSFCVFKGGEYLGKVSGPQTPEVYIGLFDRLIEYENQDITSYIEYFFQGAQRFW